MSALGRFCRRLTSKVRQRDEPTGWPGPHRVHAASFLACTNKLAVPVLRELEALVPSRSEVVKRRKAS